MAVHRDLESVAVRIMDELADVLSVAGSEHGDRLLVHDVPKVISGRLQYGIVEMQLPAQILEVIAQ